MSYAIRLGSIALFAIGMIAGCNNQHSVGSTYFKGYLSTDSCASLAAQADCLAKTGCDWIEPKCPSGVPCPAGVCYEPNKCFAITDPAQCKSDSSCAWSSVQKLCPVGTSCPSGGFCHPQDPSGGPCACVTALGCPAGEQCPPPECDCTGGGSGGGTCTCACPDCPPGQSCAPCKCECGPGGSGCVNGGTCSCSCPPCAAGTTCPPCACGCGSGGAVPVPAPDPTGSTAPDPCAKFTDPSSCGGDVTDKCQWYAFGKPCVTGQPCVSGVCQSPSATGGGGTGGGCACSCPGCDPKTMNCPPCACDCGGENPGCVPPSMPPGTACPAIACNPQPSCPNGVTKDANGCPTCSCA
jgi:hypothetical protein